MVVRYCLPLALVGLLSIVATAGFAFPMECVVKSSGEMIQGFWIDGSAFVLLHPSDNDFGPDLEAFETGSMDGNQVDCDSTAVKASRYPVVITSEDELHALGIASDFFAKVEGPATDAGLNQPAGAAVLNDEPNKCFYIGVGQLVRFSLSEAIVSRYRQKGVSLDNLCEVMASGEVRFDPETGERLPTFVLVAKDGSGAFYRSYEYPLVVPACFGRGKLEIDATRQFYAVLQPLGCDLKFHPWSGRKLTADKSAFYAPRTFLYISGDPAVGALDGAGLAKDSGKHATAADIAALKALLLN